MNIKETIKRIEGSQDYSKLSPKNRKYRDHDLNRLKDEIKDELNAKSDQMIDVVEMAFHVALFEYPILLLGESGTGKGTIAKSIHKICNIQNGVNYNFTQINCAALKPELLESELFGHKRGSFTGAETDKTGLLENQGTVFLDEIAELPVDCQSKILLAIEEKKIRPLGSVETKNIMCRIITATNTDIHQKVQDKKFREDLYHRLMVMQIIIAPLRERKEDINGLVDYFIKKINTENKNCDNFPKTITEDAINYLHDYDWPGNVRQLNNVLIRAAVWGNSNSITIDDVEKGFNTDIIKRDLNEFLNPPFPIKLPELVNKFENYQIKRAIDESKTQKDAAKKLGICESNLSEKKKKFESGNDISR